MNDNKGKNYYSEIIEKINNSIKKKKYDEALDLIVEEMSMPYIPMEIEPKLSMLFRKVSLLIEDKMVETKYRTLLKEEEIIESINSDNPEPIYLELAINSLKKINIRNIIKELKLYLSNPEKNDFIKAMILSELVNQNYDKEIKIIKNKKETRLKPIDIKSLENMPSLAYISRLIEDNLFSDQSHLLIAFGIMQTYLIFFFPTEISKEKYTLVSAASHYISSIYLRKEITLEEIKLMYKINDDKEFFIMLDDIQDKLNEKHALMGNV